MPKMWPSVSGNTASSADGSSGGGDASQAESSDGAVTDGNYGGLVALPDAGDPITYSIFVRDPGTAASDDNPVIQKIEELKERVGIKKTIKDYGIDEKYFLETLDKMVEDAFDDQCTGANPRYPLMSEIKEMYLKAYYGR